VDERALFVEFLAIDSLISECEDTEMYNINDVRLDALRQRRHTIVDQLATIGIMKLADQRKEELVQDFFLR